MLVYLDHFLIDFVASVDEFDKIILKEKKTIENLPISILAII